MWRPLTLPSGIEPRPDPRPKYGETDVLDQRSGYAVEQYVI